MVSQTTPSPEAQDPRRSSSTSTAVLLADLVALALILTAIVAIVVFGNASTAVISAVGGAISIAFRAWRKRAAAV